MSTAGVKSRTEARRANRVHACFLRVRAEHEAGGRLRELLRGLTRLKLKSADACYSEESLRRLFHRWKKAPCPETVMDRRHGTKTGPVIPGNLLFEFIEELSQQPRFSCREAYARLVAQYSEGSEPGTVALPVSERTLRRALCPDFPARRAAAIRALQKIERGRSLLAQAEREIEAFRLFLSALLDDSGGRTQRKDERP